MDPVRVRLMPTEGFSYPIGAIILMYRCSVSVRVKAAS